MVSTPHDGNRPCLPPSMLRLALDHVPSQQIAIHDDISRDQNVPATFDNRVRPWGAMPVPAAACLGPVLRSSPSSSALCGLIALSGVVVLLVGGAIFGLLDSRAGLRDVER